MKQKFKRYFLLTLVNKQIYPAKRMPYFYLHHQIRPHLLKMSDRCFRMHIHICSGKKLVLTLIQNLPNRQRNSPTHMYVEQEFMETALFLNIQLIRKFALTGFFVCWANSMLTLKTLFKDWTNTRFARNYQRLRGSKSVAVSALFHIFQIKLYFNFNSFLVNTFHLFFFYYLFSYCHVRWSFDSVSNS